MIDRRNFVREAAGLLACLALALPASSSAGPPGVEYQLVHSFHGPEGRFPDAALAAGGDGWLYGTTSSGGNDGAGTAFRMRPDGSTQLLHSFTPDEALHPRGIVRARDGNFYGVSFGKGDRPGTAYRISPDGDVTLLHTFSEGNGGCTKPSGTLIQGADGDFYGTTFSGGEFKAWGCIFRMSAAGEVTVLHSFNYDRIDGMRPEHGLVQASDGKLYGTTYSGGSGELYAGTIFRIGTDGSGYEILHVFHSPDPVGEFPGSALVDGGDGWLYGVTLHGGPYHVGVVYRVNLQGQVELMHAFGDGSRRADAIYPEGELLLASDGHFYGVSSTGGKHGTGTVFQMARDGTTRLIHQFGREAPHARRPRTALVETPEGELLGTTSKGGRNDLGAVYKLKVD